MADHDKTEKATPRRRQKAREKGQVARSRELIASLSVGAAVLVLGVQASSFVPLWRGLLGRTLESAVTGSLEASAMTWMSLTIVRATVVVIGLSWLVAVVSAMSQGGLVFAGDVLQPNFERLSPASRLEQLFSLPSLGRLLKSLLPGTAIVYVALSMLVREWPSMIGIGNVSAGALAIYVAKLAFEMGWKSVLVLLLWSGVDYWIERHKLEGDLRMSREDLRDEYKETEGNPTVKARIRRLRRQVLRRRMLEDVRRAAVVITNPSEFAVALEYSTEMAAPTVVAKGRNLLAKQIKEAARWHGIPMVENPPLAHALYRAVEIGQAIPPKLYAVVAAILAAIYRAQERARRASEARTL